MRQSSKSHYNTTSSLPSPFSHPSSSRPTLQIHHIVLLKHFTHLSLLKHRKRRSRNRQYRLNIIKQWIQTETNYVRDLNIIIHNMKIPMKQKSILTQQQLKTVFSNIQSILLLSQKLLEELIKIRENWQPDSILISVKLNHFYPYLKIYSEYYNNYHLAQNIINEIKTLEDVQEIMKSLVMDFESYLIKPIQGPLKYELLMKQYWNHMPKGHPDYQGIKDTILKYTKVNTSNNDQLGHKEKIAKIIRLGKIYGELVRPGRELIREFVASTFFVSLVKVYLFTDLILITRHENGKEVYEKVIELDGRKSFIEYKNSKYGNDLTVIICGVRQAVHLRFMSKNLMQIACGWIQTEITNLLQKQKTKQNILNKKYSKTIDNKTTTAFSLQSINPTNTPSIKVVCIGVYKKSISMVKNRTYYILKISFNFNVELCQYIFVRFSQIEKLKEELGKKYKSVLLPGILFNLASFKQMSVTDISLDPANIVAYRTFCIPEFLNFVFRCEKIMENPQIIMNSIGIQENLWEYCFNNTKQNLQCGCKLCITVLKNPFTISQQLSLRQLYVKKCSQMTKPQFCLHSHLLSRSKLLSLPPYPSHFPTLQSQLLYLQYTQGRINYNMIYRSSKAKLQFNIRVSLMSLEHENVEIKINEESTVGEVLDAICKYFRMYNYKDFSLFIQSGSEMRLLDEDELIYQILRENEENIELVEQKGCFNVKNISSWSRKLFKQKPSKLYFGKYLFLSPTIQKQACQESDIRYRFIVQQIFYYIHKKLIILSDSEMKRIVALYLCLRLEEQIQRLTKENIPLEKILQFIPSQQVTSKWILEVINIVSVEKNLLQGTGSDKNFFKLIYNRIFQIAEKKIGWKSLLLPVTQYKESKTLYLGISIEGMVVLEKLTHNVLLHIPIQLLKFRMEPFLITIDFGELECKFEGNGMFNFSKMAEKYCILNQVFGEGKRRVGVERNEQEEEF